MNDDWVARLLAEAERPAMPADVAERLEQGLRRHLTDDGAEAPAARGPQAGPSTAAAGVAGVAAGGAAASPADVAATPDQDAPDEASATGTQDPAVSVGPTGATGPRGDEPTTSAPTRSAPTTTAPTGSETTGTSDRSGTGDRPTPTDRSSTDGATASGGRPVPGAVPAPAVVPPAAGAGAAAAPLRAGADETTRSPGDGSGDGAPQSRSRDGRTFGTPRREQRVDDQGERRRRLLTRWVPVAAGVLVLGAAGAMAVNVLGGGSDSTADTAEEVAAADVAESVAPRSLVATGTEYTTADVPTFEQQVRDLVALAASGTEDSSAAAEDDSAGAGAAAPSEASASVLSSPAQADPAAARASAADNPLADAAALQECVETVTDGTDEDAAAVDLALVDGVESTVVVVPDPAGANLFVYVVGPDCTGVDSQFQFFTVAP